MTPLRQFSEQYPALLALILAVLLFLVGGIIDPGFVNTNQAINIVRLAAFLGIIAAGQTLIIISGNEGIDLSVAGIVTLSAILVYRFTDGQDSLMLPTLALALGVGTVIGAINGLGIIVLNIPPLVMTLGMAGVIQGTILVVTQGNLIGDTPPLLVDMVSNFAVLMVIWIVLALLIWLLLERTTYGKQLFAIGVNRTTARLSGVRVPLVVIATYALSGMLAALGGFILLGFTGTVFLNLGDPYLFPSIAAVVVGGTVLAGGKGGYFGTMAGALVLTLINSLLRAAQLQEAYQLMVLGVILLLLLSIYGRQRSLRQ
jgi:ribose transport system permease protein